MRAYAHPEVLVSTQWVSEHLSDPTVCVVESDEDLTLYHAGHLHGAVMVDWVTELQNRISRDFVDRQGFEALMAKKGIARDQTVVFYGDNNNWWACYAFWVFLMYGHPNLRIMDGGRQKWLAEGRPITREVVDRKPVSYKAGKADASVRAFVDRVLAHQRAGRKLVDVRSPGEYTGELQHMPDYPQEGALRTGHIPGAVSCPWSRAVAPDGTFRSAEDLAAIYEGELKLRKDDPVIVYCRIGERSSHTFFVLRYLLGFSDVRNYDGSWTEWGNLVGVPIERQI
jgi:thiosulfate/3-mercaptopyruvate sulfurtransferase